MNRVVHTFILSRTRNNRWLAALILTLVSTASASAHHGLDGFDQTNLIELEGRVVGFELRDPHSVLFIEVENPDGSRTEWEIEGGAARGVVQAGLSREFLSSGPTVRVTAYRSKDLSCQPRCLASGRNFDFDR